jgi:hypothetical protein
MGGRMLLKFWWEEPEGRPGHMREDNIKVYLKEKKKMG